MHLNIVRWAKDVGSFCACADDDCCAGEGCGGTAAATSTLATASSIGFPPVPEIRLCFIDMGDE